MFTLVAQNEQGARIFYGGKSMAEALRKFDDEFGRKGFRIWILYEGDTVKIIKHTYR